MTAWFKLAVTVRGRIELVVDIKARVASIATETGYLVRAYLRASQLVAIPVPLMNFLLFVAYLGSLAHLSLGLYTPV